MAKKLPSKIGNYAVEDRIGEGGMGEVLKGEHALLGRPVAIKRLLAEIADNAEMAERFQREGRALAQLSHQGICAVHDLFEQRGALYMVLEYVDGFDVDTLLKQGGYLPVDVAAIIALKVAEALEHAHHHRIIHRDIKPANVMVSKQGEVKLMDFGIALDEDLDRVTRSGMMVGTPMYMAPEVVSGGQSTEQSDVYAVGAMLYQCLSGRKVFAHASAENIYALIASGKFPAIKKVAPHVPRALRRIVDRALQKKPGKRFSDAAELRRALDDFLSAYRAWSHYEERLVAFLHADGHIGEQEALTFVDIDIATVDFALKPPRTGLKAAAALLAVGLGTGAVTFALARTGMLDELRAKVEAERESATDAAP